ncbi:MAG: tetratricopeptide repeat protein [Acidobacteriia bacterium]|nr:tetratricopeptide repeat protein [Terriglobia bacterium]
MPKVTEVVIELEEVPVVEPEVVSASETAPTSPALAAPTQDDLEEIAFYIDQGMVQDARHRIVALRSRGKAGAALDALEARAAAAASSTPERAPVVETADDSTDRSESVLDDEALESISEALVAEAAAAGQTAAAPASFDEQSVEEVFELFKQHVDREIGSEDHRTHYDLGIAYKEMGLLDDAVGEFQVASRAPDLFRDACTMIALCLREKGEVQEAAGWYRQALDAPGGDDEALRGLRFDLAEVLEQCGDTKAALDLFRSIHRDDPSYREVGRKIAELESRGR